jgi:hypothetical protein
MGLTPARAAKAASERRRPACDQTEDRQGLLEAVNSLLQVALASEGTAEVVEGRAFAVAVAQLTQDGQGPLVAVDGLPRWPWSAKAGRYG